MILMIDVSGDSEPSSLVSGISVGCLIVRFFSWLQLLQEPVTPGSLTGPLSVGSLGFGY